MVSGVTGSQARSGRGHQVQVFAQVHRDAGADAGAGIAAHLHQHVVPRWGGDSNFMPVVGQTRVLPQLLTQTRDLLAAAWPGRQP